MRLTSNTLTVTFLATGQRVTGLHQISKPAIRERHLRIMNNEAVGRKEGDEN